MLYSMYLLMLFEILRAFERFLADLQRKMLGQNAPCCHAAPFVTHCTAVC